MAQINLDEDPGDPAAHSMTPKYCFLFNQFRVKNISTTITMYDFNNFIFVKTAIINVNITQIFNKTYFFQFFDFFCEFKSLQCFLK